MINQSPDYYNVSHNNLWLNEVSDKFGTAHTLNDWWNLPLSFSAYNKDIRNADELTLAQLKHLSDNQNDINLQKNLAIFTHATNHKTIEELIQTHNLPMNVVTTTMGESSHLYVTSWLRREYNTIMNVWDNEESAWHDLLHQRIVKDKQWTSNCTLQMHEWLLDPMLMYTKLNITPCKDMNIWSKEYCTKNGIINEFDNDLYWSDEHRGTITKLSVMLRLVNDLLKSGVSINSTQIYAKRFYEEHIKDWSISWKELDQKVKSFIGLSVDI